MLSLMTSPNIAPANATISAAKPATRRRTSLKYSAQ